LRRKEAKDRSNFRKKLLIVALSFLFLILFIASFFGKNGWIEMDRAKKKQRALLQEIERLEEMRSQLEREIEELKKNPKAVEKKAREELWLMDPDEIVIIKENEEKDK
jgi:cell division protein FtsB